MSDLLPALLILLVSIAGLQLAATGVVVYRLLAKRVIDPLGLDKRVSDLNERVGAVERYQNTLARQAMEADRRHIERLDELAAQQSKLLGHMTAIESLVSSERKERREQTTRMDQVVASLANFGQRFGAFEAGLKQVLDARPSEVNP